jgi:hypothetical protein
MSVPKEMESYRTAPRPKGATSGGVNPRPGEDPTRGGQKTYDDDPGGVEATDKTKKLDKESDASR